MKPDAMDIRLAVPGDSARLLPLIAAHAAFEGGEISITPDTLEAILRARDPEIRIIVAADGERLVGFAALTFDFSLWRARRWAHLDCLFVHETHRGRTLGRLLLGAAQSAARLNGADRMEWQTPAWNTPAIRFYLAQEALGMTKMRFVMSV